MLISIVITNYNYERYLDAAIRSAMAQTYSNKEVIVVDDGSSDGSRRVIERWGQKVRVVLQDNGGQSSAYNSGFALARGDIVLFLDADDLLDANACQQIVASFAPGVVKVHYRLRIIDASGTPLGPVFPSVLHEGRLHDLLLQHGQLYASAPSSGNAYLASALRQIMPIRCDPRDRHGADFFTIYGISLLGEVRTVGKGPLGAYRMHRDGAGQTLFGNAAHESREPEASYRRHADLSDWLRTRLGAQYALPPLQHDFSLEKQGYARALFDCESYRAGLWRGAPYLLRRLLPAIGRRPGSRVARLALAGWACAVLLLPRPVGRPLARLVCNPASRSKARNHSRQATVTS